MKITYAQGFFLTVISLFGVQLILIGETQIDTSHLQVGLADIKAELAALEVEMPKHGWGFVKRIVNHTKYPLGVHFTETLHDKLPNGTIVRIKSNDPRLGSSGRYYAVVKGYSDSFVLSPSESDAKKAARFEVHHLLTRTLVDWLGFSYAGTQGGSGPAVPDNAFMGFDGKNGLVVLEGTEKDFIKQDNKQYHWKLLGDETLKNAKLVNRATQQAMWPFKGQKSVVTETVSRPIDEVWGVKIFKKTIPAQTEEKPVDQTLRFGEQVHLMVYRPEDNTWRHGITSENPMHTVNLLLCHESGDGAQLKGQAVKFGDFVCFNIPGTNHFFRITGYKGKNQMATRFNEHTGDFSIIRFRICDKDGQTPDRAVLRTDFLRLIAERSFHGQGPDMLKRQFMSAAPQGDFEHIISNDRYPHKLFGFNKDPRTRLVTIAEARDVIWAELFADIKGTTRSLGKDIKQVAIVNPNVIWGVSTSNRLLRWNNNQFEDPQFSIDVDYVAAGPNTDNIFLMEYGTGHIYQCSKRGKIEKLQQQPSSKLKELAVINDGLLWGRDETGLLQRYTGRWESTTVDGKKVKSVTVTTDGTVRAITENDALFNYDSESKRWLVGNRPAGDTLRKVSGDYGISVNKIVYRYDASNNVWRKIASGYDDVFAANGFFTADRFETRDIDAATALEEADAQVLKFGDVVQLWSVKGDKPWAMCTDSDSDRARWGLEAMSVRNAQGKASGAPVCYGDMVTFNWTNGSGNFLYAFPGNQLGGRPLGEDASYYGFQILDTGGNASKKHVLRGEKFKLRGLRHGEFLKADDARQIFLRLAGVYDTFATNVSSAQKMKDPAQAIITFEIEKLGDTAGQIPPGGASSFDSIPADKSPNVVGFAESFVGPFMPGQILTLPPMRGQGGAFLEEPFTGRGVFSVVANTKERGGLQLLLGDGVKDSYLYKAVIGGTNNMRSVIVKRTYEGLKPKDTVVAENTAIVTTPGDDTVYWMSYDQGRIKVGKTKPSRQNPGGNYIGEGTFMSWIDPLPDTLPTKVAVATEQKEISCSYLRKTTEPVVVQQPTQSKERNPEMYKIPLTGKIPFRVHDCAMLSFRTATDKEQGLFLEKSTTADYYYLIVFGEGADKNITIYKGMNTAAGKPNLIRCAALSGKSFPAIRFSPKEPKTFWVSYNQGLLMVGMRLPQKGNPSLELLIYNDMDYTQGIDSFRFYSSGKSAISTVRVSAPAQLGVDRNLDVYAKDQVSLGIYGGKVILLTPFDWQFGQDEEAFTCYDNISRRGPARIAKITEPGAFYDFNIDIAADGMPQPALLTDPKNPKKLEFTRNMLAMEAAAGLKRKEGELEAKAGELEARKLKTIGERAKREQEIKAQELIGRAGVMESTGEVLGTIAGSLGQGGAIAQGVAAGLTATAAGLAIGAQVEKYQAVGERAAGERAALAKEAEAEHAALQGERQAALRESEATIIEAKSKALQGFMDKLAVNGADTYVYLENVSRPAISETEVAAEIKEKKTQFLALLDQVDLLDLRDKDKADEAVTLCTKLLLDVDHYYLISEEKVRQRIKRLLEKIFEQIGKETSLFCNMVDLFFIAYNNPFLNDESSVETMQRRLWLSHIRNMANVALKDCNDANLDAEFRLRNTFGEYVSLGKLPQANEGLVTFEVQGLNDLFFCFARSNDVKIRNSVEEIYEFDIDGWEGTRSVLRVNSLGISVADLHTEQQLLSSQEWRQVWFNLYKGYVCMGTGDPAQRTQPLLAWRDPYPPTNITYAMVGSWNSPISIRKIAIKQALPLTLSGQGATKKRIIRRSRIKVAKPSEEAEVSTGEEEMAAIEAEVEASAEEKPAEVPEETAAEGAQAPGEEETVVTSEGGETEVPEASIPDVPSEDAAA